MRTELIEPALDRLGLIGKTTGEIVKAGHIHADMFQRLLTADLVVAEVSIHNANVFYELGIRHALRQHRTFMLRSKGDKYPFDLEGYRYLTYDREVPAAALDELVNALRATLDSTGQDSPVFRSLPGLRENIWQRSNLWILSNALDKAGRGSHLTLLALWNGKKGDGAGGTEDMVEQARKRGARTVILPTAKLFGLAG